MASDRPTPEPNRGDRRKEMVMSEPNVVDGSTLHLLPADAYPGLLDGWCGPVDTLTVFEEWEPAVCWNGSVRDSIRASGPVRLDLRRPECAHRVRDVLKAAGHDLDWTRDLPAWQAAAVLAASVLRVSAGEAAVLTMFRANAHMEDFGEGLVLAGFALDQRELDSGHAVVGGGYILVPLPGGRVACVEAEVSDG